MVKIKNQISECVSGATFTMTDGFWVDKNGNPTKETTVKIEISYTEDDVILELCNSLKLILNQNCILVKKKVDYGCYI